MTMTAPVKAMVEKRKASLAAPLRILSLNTKLVPRLPTMYPKKPKLHTRFTVSIVTPVLRAR